MQGATLHSENSHMSSHTLHTLLHRYDFIAQNLHTIHNNTPSLTPNIDILWKITTVRGAENSVLLEILIQEFS